MAQPPPGQFVSGPEEDHELQPVTSTNPESPVPLSSLSSPLSEVSACPNIPQNADDHTHDMVQNEQTTHEDLSMTHPTSLQNALHSEEWAEFSDSFEQNVAAPGRKALHKFFFPPRQQISVVKASARTDSRRQLADPPSTPITSATTMTDEPSPFHEKKISTAQNLSSTTISTERNAMGNRNRSPASPPRIEDDPAVIEQDRQDREYVETFWTTYDDIIILSLFTQLGILCRLGMASWLRFFDGVFQNESALFTNLPLNCFSCFVMGLLCSGESLMQIIGTRFTPPRLQQDVHRESAIVLSPSTRDTRSIDEDDSYLDDGDAMSPCSRDTLRRRQYRSQRRTGTTVWQAKNDNLQDELRDVQLLAFERRIRASPCLLLFPGKKQDVDVVENYFYDGYQRRRDSRDSNDSTFSPLCKSEKRIRGSFANEESCHMANVGFSLDNHDLVLDEEICFPEAVARGGKGKRLDFESLDETPVEDDDFNDEFVVDNDHPPKDRSPEAAILRRKATLNVEENRDVRKHATASVHVSAVTTDCSLVGETYNRQRRPLGARQYGKVDGNNTVDYGTQDQPDLDQIITNVAADVSQKISRIKRVRLADGWDVGTTPQEKSDDLILGLRDGLCGALSSFSSWISAMVNLLRGGNIGQAFVGLVLGIQLPIVAYRFGQHIALYIFVWRCRRETKRDDRRGYGLRLSMDDDDIADNSGIAASVHSLESGDSISRGRRSHGRQARTVHEEASETPSVRAIITAIFIMALVAQTTALNFFYDPKERLVALSLLFSPLGVLARWRLSKLNCWRPNFPIGTFACNVGACALSGSLGSLLAGNPGPRERIALVAIIAGFGGTLSSVARFIVEVLAGVDPILFRVDGVYYAAISLFWGMLVSFLFTASGDWADYVE